jgi:hypothetical protein
VHSVGFLCTTTTTTTIIIIIIIINCRQNINWSQVDLNTIKKKGTCTALE